MSNLQDDLHRIRQELTTARVEELRLAARIKGLEAERDALTAAISGSQAQPEASLALTNMTKDRAIVAVLQAADRPMRIGEIVDALHEAGRPREVYNGISVYLDTLLRQGRVLRPARGLYTTPEDDKDAEEGHGPASAA